MNEKNDLQRGWDFSAHLIGADVAAHAGSQYVAQVNEAIEQLATIPRAVIPKSQVHNTIQKARYETIDIKMVRRGVIGVNKVGYMLS